MEMNYDDATLRQIEHELGVAIYPGTEIMTDVGSSHFVKGSGSKAVLVPQPSADPNDPLNWSLKWKTITIALTTAVTFSQGFGPLALAPMFPYLMKDFNASLAACIQFTGVAILVLGFSNFIWVPLQSAFGRRPVLILSTLICFIANVWRAKAKTYSSFMGACVLNGIGAGPAETAQPQIIADVFFLHERGAWNTLYFAFYFGSLMVGPIISGSIALHSNWRNFWWLNAAMLGLLTILCIFLFPETKWHRAHPKDLLQDAARATADDSSQEKSQVVHEEPDSISNNAGVKNENSTGVAAAQMAADVSALSKTATLERDPFLGKGTPSKKQFKPFQPSPRPFHDIYQQIWIPIKLHILPIIELAAFVVSWSASCFLTINLTQSQVFAYPPYNLSSQTIGFFNFAILVGAAIGLLTNGALSDWISMRATKKNRGIREPEMRLPALIPYVIIMLLGNFVVAFGYQYQWPWEAIVIIGYTCAGIQVTAIPAIISTYAVDSYKPVAGPIFVSITVNKNVWGYGFSKFINEWTVEAGYLPAIMTNMCLTFLFCACAIIFFTKARRSENGPRICTSTICECSVDNRISRAGTGKWRWRHGIS